MSHVKSCRDEQTLRSGKLPGEFNTDILVFQYRVAHSIILAHVDAVQAYVSDFQPTQSGSISMVLNGDFYEPYNPANEDDIKAAQRRMEFYVGWFADPVYLGADYPASMRARLGPRLPHFSQPDRERLKLLAPHSSFYGMNHYTSQFARARLTPPDEYDFTGNIDELPHDSNGTEIGPVSGVPWLRVTHRQFRKLLNWVWHRYQRPIYITENGCPCPGESRMTVTEAVNDGFRVRYFGLYLDAVSRAIFQDCVKVSGYYAWSLMDNFGTCSCSRAAVPNYLTQSSRVVSWIRHSVWNNSRGLCYAGSNAQELSVLPKRNFQGATKGVSEPRN